MDAQAGANTLGWLHSLATQLEQASTDVLEKKMTNGQGQEATPELVDKPLSEVVHGTGCWPWECVCSLSMTWEETVEENR